MRRTRIQLALVTLAVAVASASSPAAARELKLWPLFDYTSEAETGTQSLKILGPLIEYTSDPKYRTIALRPILSVRQARVGHDDEVRVLYPLMTSRWSSEEQTTRSFGGLLTYRTTTSTDGKTLTGQHFRALPFYFYDWDGEHGSRVSAIPIFADLHDVAGFERVQMVLFPGFLRLQQPRYERRFWLYPFFSEVDGPSSSGFAVWPAYGHMRVDDTYEGGFTGWPFYIWDVYKRGDETQQRFISFPFYARVDGPRRESRAYGTFLYVHTLDRASETESWAFPWPLWEYQDDTATGATRMLRLLPFYEARHEGPLETRTVAWPLYTDRRYADAVHTYRRTDGLLLLVHRERDTELASGKTSHVFALFPGVVDEGAPEWDRGGAPALVDAMLPHETGVRELYAPLWRAYAWDGPIDSPRISFLWGAVTRTQGVTTYPWRWDPGQ